MKLLNLKELNFKNNSTFMQTDPDEQLDDPTQLGYYTRVLTSPERQNVTLFFQLALISNYV